jgi:hypothetical protein
MIISSAARVNVNSSDTDIAWCRDFEYKFKFLDG